MRAGDLCHLAAELASEHGAAALDYARRAVAEFEQCGAHDRAAFWTLLGAFLDDIMSQRLDPEAPIVLN
ncbi:MAG TPA: hypothetical protein VMH86_12790 [Rhizomicrobium sp.]|nr:hypothetical protein [Rhizomicrobium sp.]